jgi:Mn2+/Fe2+ NRAMP family transporter
MWFIIVTTGATLFRAGIHNIQTAQDAALALKPFAGDFSFLFFSLGIVGTGLLAVPILAGSASYAVSEAFSWRPGLYAKLRSAHGFYGAITLSSIVGLLINFVGINPMQGLYYAALINGIIAPPLIIAILLIANNRRIMGDRINGLFENTLGVLTVVVMSIAAVLLAITSLV